MASAQPDLATWNAEPDTGSLRFEWWVRIGDPRMVASDLAAAAIQFAVSTEHADENDFVLLQRLEAVGINLHQEYGPGPMQPARAKYIGCASPARLASALDAILAKARTGLIVDTVEGSVEIDEHQDVGIHVIALLEPSGARLVHGDAARTLRAAFGIAIGRQLGQATR